VSIVEFESGRQAAMLEVVAGYQRGLVKLHPDDHEERAWFLLRLRDVWTMYAFSSPVVWGQAAASGVGMGAPLRRAS